jgi:hypothetical protein
LNVADYDVVILNFAAFVDEALANGFPKERLPGREAMARLLFSPGSEIIAIGDPATKIGQPPSAEMRWYDSRVRADYWLPAAIVVERNNGSSYDVAAAEWQPYFEHLSSWEWIATGELQPYDREVEHYLRPVTQQQVDQVAVVPDSLASTRFGKAIALKLRVAALRVVVDGYGRRRSSPEIVLHAGSVFWLPAPDRVSTSEIIDWILSNRFGIAQEARRPAWTAGFSLPTEKRVASEITSLEQKRRQLENDISTALARAADAGRPSLLLFEKGKEVLEPVVRSALRELGAEVSASDHEGIEDGLLSYGDQFAVIEIKGRTGPIKQDDVRQVVQWASDARLRDGRDYKPIIVGNPHCDLAPSDRGEPLAPNASTYARNGGVVLLKTVQVYEALRRKQEGAFDPDNFWTQVFGGSGALDLPEPATRPSSAT